MSRKDYIEAASAIAQARETRELRDDENLAAQQALDYASEGLARYFAADNPRFDRRRFLVACGTVPA